LSLILALCLKNTEMKDLNEPGVQCCKENGVSIKCLGMCSGDLNDDTKKHEIKQANNRELKQIGRCEKHLDTIRVCQEFTKDETIDDQFDTKKEFNSSKQDISTKLDNLIGRQEQGQGKRRPGKKRRLRNRNPKECKDISSKCSKQKRKCGKRKFVTKRCQKTCGICQSANLRRQRPVTDTSETAVLECKDKSSRCARQQQNCRKSKFVNQRCQKTCGACQSSNLRRQRPVTDTSETALLECKDISSRCAKQKSNCGKSKFVSKRCQKTCGICHDEDDDDYEDDEDFDADNFSDVTYPDTDDTYHSMYDAESRSIPEKDSLETTSTEMNEDGSDSQENPITDEASDPYDYSY